MLEINDKVSLINFMLVKFDKVDKNMFKKEIEELEKKMLNEYYNRFKINL